MCVLKTVAIVFDHESSRPFEILRVLIVRGLCRSVSFLGRDDPGPNKSTTFCSQTDVGEDFFVTVVVSTQVLRRPTSGEEGRPSTRRPVSRRPERRRSSVHLGLPLWGFLPASSSVSKVRSKVCFRNYVHEDVHIKITDKTLSNLSDVILYKYNFTCLVGHRSSYNEVSPATGI